MFIHPFPLHRSQSVHRRWRRGRLPVTLAAAAAVVLGTSTGASARLAIFEHAGPQGDGTSITPTGWHVTPAGRQTQLGERPYGMAMSPDGSHLLVSNDGVATQSVMLVDTATRKVTSEISYAAPEAVYLGVAFSPDGKRAYVSAGANDKVRVYDVHGDALSERAPLAVGTPAGTSGPQFTAGLALSSDGRQIFVADNLTNAVSVLDTQTGEERRVPLSSRACVFNNFGSDPSNGTACNFPYTVVLSGDGRSAYVSASELLCLRGVDVESIL